MLVTEESNEDEQAVALGLEALGLRERAAQGFGQGLGRLAHVGEGDLCLLGGLAQVAHEVTRPRVRAE